MAPIITILIIALEIGFNIWTFWRAFPLFLGVKTVCKLVELFYMLVFLWSAAGWKLTDNFLDLTFIVANSFNFVEILFKFGHLLVQNRVYSKRMRSVFPVRGTWANKQNDGAFVDFSDVF